MSQVLLIAIGYGQWTDPYSCSYVCPSDEVDINDPIACREAIANAQDLELDTIDEVLVVCSPQPMTIKQYGGQNGFGDKDQYVDTFHFDDLDEEWDEEFDEEAE